MCIIGLCVLLELPSRPAAVEAVAGQIVPSILLLFLGLKHIYASRVLHKQEALTRAQRTEEDENGRRGEWGISPRHMQPHAHVRVHVLLLPLTTQLTSSC